jgi:cytochrome c peroxidase
MGKRATPIAKTKSPVLWRATPLIACSTLFVAAAAYQGPGDNSFTNAAGIAGTVTTNGVVDTTNPFFQSLGTNGRSCVTCHQAADNWSVSAADVRKRFNATGGTDPIFRTNDGANSPNADVSTVTARRKAYSMLVNKGLIRVERPIPANAEFDLLAVDDPYHYASAAGLSLFRRPLPSTNLRFISTVMWDGREVDPITPMTIPNPASANHDILLASLSHQALDATNGHAQGSQDLSLEQREQIVDFEMGLSTAQQYDFKAGFLNAAGATGGPVNIQGFPFYIGINDNVNDPSGPFSNTSMLVYDTWKNSSNPARRAIARGEELFNSKDIVISRVKGLNDNPYFGSPDVVTGTCTTCHNTPNMGNHSLAVALDIGLTDASRRTADMPLYTLRNKTTGVTVQTTDPGLALSTGKWKDIARFKGPVLRGLAGRAPYFHNGSAADLNAVLDFYQSRFGVTFKPQERSDLIAFLNSL